MTFMKAAVTKVRRIVVKAIKSLAKDKPMTPPLELFMSFVRNEKKKQENFCRRMGSQ